MARELRSFVIRYSLLDSRHDFREQRIAELVEVAIAQLGMTPRVPARPNHFHGPVAQRHDHDHGLGFSLRDQIVENHVGAPDRRPSAGIVAETVQQIKDGISFLRGRIVARRRVDVVIAVVTRDRGLVEVMMDLAVRHIVQFPRQRRRPGNMNRIPRRNHIRHQRGIRRHRAVRTPSAIKEYP